MLRSAGRRLEVGPGSSPEVEDLHAPVHDDAGGRVLVQKKALGSPNEVKSSRRSRLRDRRRVWNDISSWSPLEGALDRGPGEDLVLLVDQPKEIRPVGDVLRVTEQEKPGLVQREVEVGKHPLLQLLAEVDENVAAAHQVKFREGRIGCEIVLHERAPLAHGLADSVSATLHLGEEARQPFRAHVSNRSVGIEAGTRLLDRLLADIRAEELHGHVGCVLLSEKLEERDEEGIGLFSSRTAR